MSWQNRILLVLALVASAALLPREEELGGEDLARVRDEAASLRAVNEALQSEIDKLEAEVLALRSGGEPGPAGEAGQLELARIARKDLGLIRPGELVFELEGREP